jgi:hypothetical protein
MKIAEFAVDSSGNVTPTTTQSVSVGGVVVIYAGESVIATNVYATWNNEECCQQVFGVAYLRLNQQYIVLHNGPATAGSHYAITTTDPASANKAGHVMTGTNGKLHVGSTTDDPDEHRHGK